MLILLCLSITWPIWFWSLVIPDQYCKIHDFFFKFSKSTKSPPSPSHVCYYILSFFFILHSWIENTFNMNLVHVQRKETLMANNSTNVKKKEQMPPNLCNWTQKQVLAWDRHKSVKRNKKGYGYKLHIHVHCIWEISSDRNTSWKCFRNINRFPLLLHWYTSMSKQAQKTRYHYNVQLHCIGLLWRRFMTLFWLIKQLIDICVAFSHEEVINQLKHFHNL